MYLNCRNVILYNYYVPGTPRKRRILFFFKLILVNSDGKMDRDILVQVYFSFGLSYQETVRILASNHGVIISL